MTLKSTLAAALAVGLMCGTALAQASSPNPNKAQNSAMRTQSGMYPYALYPDGSLVPGHTYRGAVPSVVQVVPAPVVSEPTAGMRNLYVPSQATPAMPAEGVPAIPSETAAPSTESTN
jgi:hypothetical protein